MGAETCRRSGGQIVYFDSLSAVLTMEGHGVYVWSAYLVAIVTIALVLIVPARRSRRFMLNLAAELRRVRGPQDGRAREDR